MSFVVVKCGRVSHLRRIGILRAVQTTTLVLKAAALISLRHSLLRVLFLLMLE